MADNTILDEQIALGFTEVSTWNTTVVALSGGNEVRNARWQAPLRRYEFNYNPRPLADVQAVLAFFHDARGMARTWLLKSWTDYRLENGVIGTGDGSDTTFQIVKAYGTLQPYSRTLTYIKSGSLSVTVDGTPATSVGVGSPDIGLSAGVTRRLPRARRLNSPTRRPSSTAGPSTRRFTPRGKT